VISNDIEGDENLRDAEKPGDGRGFVPCWLLPLEVQGRGVGARSISIANAAGVRFDSDLLELLAALGKRGCLSAGECTACGVAGRRKKSGSNKS